MTEAKKVLVYYPGHHGAETATTMRNPARGMKWAAGQVRLVPTAEAGDYVRLSGYLYALTADQVAERYGLPAAGLPQRKKLTTAVFGEGDDRETVYVLDATTRRELRKASEGLKTEKATAEDPEDSEIASESVEPPDSDTASAQS